MVTSKRSNCNRYKPFLPPFLLRNPHVQTILAGLRPRFALGRRANALMAAAQEHVLDSGDGVRLLGAYSQRHQNRYGLVILIHGWEGSIDSSYIVSATDALYHNGFNVFRLNLRDHGNSHHLNRELFNSARLLEVVKAVSEILKRFPHSMNFLAGFSLGGNFALRVGLQAPHHDLQLDKIVAVCPLISPVNTTEYLEQHLWIYHSYFVRKWQNSLKKKLRLFPDLGYGDALIGLNSLSRMNDYFVPHHTEFATARSYLEAYGVTEDRLADLTVDSHLIAAHDDPIIKIDDLNRVDYIPPSLKVEITRYGGHCGYLEDFYLNSWIDRRVVMLFKEKITEKDQ